MCLLTALFEIDDRANLGAERILHLLHDRIRHGSAARIGSVAASIGWSGCSGRGSESCATGLHLEAQRPAGSLRQRTVWITRLGLSPRATSIMHLRQRDLHQNVCAAQRPLALLQVVRQHLLPRALRARPAPLRAICPAVTSLRRRRVQAVPVRPLPPLRCRSHASLGCTRRRVRIVSTRFSFQLRSCDYGPIQTAKAWRTAKQPSSHDATSAACATCWRAAMAPVPQSRCRRCNSRCRQGRGASARRRASSGLHRLAAQQLFQR